MALAGASSTITGAAGENVVFVKDANVQGSWVIHLTGTATTTFIINVTGNFAGAAAPRSKATGRT